MTVIVEIDGLTGETEFIQKGEIEVLDLPSFITLSNLGREVTPTDTESQIIS